MRVITAASLVTSTALFFSAVPAIGSPISHQSVTSATAVTWTPHVQPSSAIARPAVHEMDQVGDTMFAGGNFDTVAHATRKVTYPRRHLFSFSASTGAVSDVAPTVDGQVWAIAHSGNAVYIGGSFRTVDGVSRPVIAKFDATTGALDEAFKPPISVGRVNDLHLSNGRLIVAGSFGAKLLALNPTTGENTRFIASAITGVLPDSTGGSHVWRTAVAPTAVV